MSPLLLLWQVRPVVQTRRIRVRESCSIRPEARNQ